MSVTGVSSDIYSNSTAPVNANASLKSEDFINLLITQLQQQDPLEPMKNSEILQQVSQIGQLQSQNELSTALKTLVLQNSLSSASGMIGKSVTGLDETGKSLTGLVTSVRVEGEDVVLELDSGKSLPMSRVTEIARETTGIAA